VNNRPEVGVGCIITRQNRDLLLMRRNSQVAQGSWSTPGGFLDYGESLEACVRPP
jgi:8-oxo-dGTP diphosphatase